MPEVKTLAEAVKKLYVSRGGTATDIKEGDDVADILAKLYEVMGGEETLPSGSTMATIVDKLSTTQGGGDTRTVKVLVKTNSSSVNFHPTYGRYETSNMGQTALPGPVYVSVMEALPVITVNHDEYLELEAPENGGIMVNIDADTSNIESVTCSENATVIREKLMYYFPSDGEINITFSGVH